MARRLRTTQERPAPPMAAELTHPDLAPFWRRTRRLSKNEDLWLAVIVLAGAVTAIGGSQ